MADYRDMAAALGGGYGQDTGSITADTLITLKNGKKATAGDLLGMLKGFGQAVGSNLESLGRGGVASVIGAGGDFESFGRTGINKLYGAGGVNVSPTPVLPTSADILGMMPRGTATRPETAGMEELGGYMTPATAKVLKPAVMATGRMAGQEINAAMTGQPTRSLLGTITPKPLQLDVYHGTPHTLPPTERNPLGEFDASKIGTGEGNQAYGYGIYTAEAPAVARAYQNTLSKYGELRFADGTVKNVQDLPYGSPEQIAGQIWINKPNLADAKFALSNLDSKYLGASKEDVLKQLESLDAGKAKLSGNLYKVDLPDEKIATMLDWDKPLSQQHPDVQAGLKGIAAKFPEIPDFNLQKWMDTDPLASTFHNVVNRDLGVDPAIIADTFQKQGITGIKYFDEGSRTAGQGTRNFVIFPGEEKNMTILERNAEKITK